MLPIPFDCGHDIIVLCLIRGLPKYAQKTGCEPEDVRLISKVERSLSIADWLMASISRKFLVASESPGMGKGKPR